MANSGGTQERQDWNDFDQTDWTEAGDQISGHFSTLNVFNPRLECESKILATENNNELHPHP